MSLADVKKHNIVTLNHDDRELIDFLNLYNNRATQYIDYGEVFSGYNNSDENVRVMISKINKLKYRHSIVFDELVKEMKKVKIREVEPFIKLAVEKVMRNLKEKNHY